MKKNDLIKSTILLEEELNSLFDSAKFINLTEDELKDKFVELSKKVIKTRLLNEFKSIANSEDLDEEIPYISGKADIVNHFLSRLKSIDYIEACLLLNKKTLLDKIEDLYDYKDKYYTFDKLFKALELEQADFYADISIKTANMEELTSFKHTDTYYDIRNNLIANIESKLPKNNTISYYCFINYYYKHTVTDEIIFCYNKVYQITFNQNKFIFKDISAKEPIYRLDLH